MLLSTGMSTLAEIDATVARVKTRACPLVVLQCASVYPSAPEQVGLSLIPFFRDRYRCQTGLSDHSGTIYPGLAAATLGASVIEVHVTLSREMFGPDISVSVTTAELRQLVDGVRWIERMLGQNVDKDTAAKDLQSVRELFTKSVVPRQFLPAGTVLREEHLTVKKPGTGIPAARLPVVLGLRLRRDLERDELLSESDLEQIEV
jgi:N,N'-diacetyllegionaminate synthase